jgi:ADP-ribose pyrophosphatase YjhB (NUDIX family)
MRFIYRRFQPRFTVGAVGVLFNEKQEVLIVEHVFHSLYPWGLPGGWVDSGEMPDQAVVREFREETRLEVKVTHPIAVWSNRYWKNHIDMAFAVTMDGSPRDGIHLSSELLSYRWASVDNLPPMLIAHHRVIEMAYDHLWGSDSTKIQPDYVEKTHRRSNL